MCCVFKCYKCVKSVYVEKLVYAGQVYFILFFIYNDNHLRINGNLHKNCQKNPSISYLHYAYPLRIVEKLELIAADVR